MKFSTTTFLFVLLGAASALPTELDSRAEPSNSPIDVRRLEKNKDLRSTRLTPI
jgi:hypothetical protein